MGRYNVFMDPIVKKMEIEEQVREVLIGRITRLIDLRVTYQDIVRFFNAEARDIQSMYVDIISYPLFAADQTMSGFVSVFMFKKIFHGREDIQIGKQFIEANWQDKYDVKAAAKAANLSPDHFSRLSKKHGPYQYLINLKLDKIRETLQDENVSIAEAFAACGVDYHSHRREKQYDHYSE